MGVKLQEIVIRNKIDFSRLEGTVIAIDAPNIIFSLFTFSYKNNQYNNSNFMTDRTQRAISHLYGLLFRANFYYSKKIFPIFCFDGKDSELKRVVTKDSLKDFLYTQEWYRDAIKSGNRALARQIAESREFLWPNIVLESKRLLGALGVPIVESPASAESQCAHLAKIKVANYANSQDFDTLLFGCPRLVQNLSKSLRRKEQGKWTYKKIEPLMINLNQSLKSLNIDRFQLVDLAILIGTDYNAGVKNIGPKTALKLLKKHNNLENIVRKEKEHFNFEHLTPELIKKVRKVFLLPEVLDSFDNLCWNPTNKSSVLALLCENHNLNRERVENNLNKLDANYSKCRTFFINNRNIPRTIQKTLDTMF